MASPPPPPTDVFEVTVEDLLVMPEIQELLSTDFSNQTRDDTTSTMPSTNHDTSSELSSVNNQGEGDVDDVGDPVVVSLEASRSIHAGDRRNNIQEQEEKQTEEVDTIPNAIAIEASSPPMTPVSTRTNTSSETFSTGQHVHALTDGELVDLGRRLKAHTASLSHDKHEKEYIRQQELRIQELQAELSRVQQVEAELKQYEQRSIESLEMELEMHQQEVASLMNKLQNAAKDELGWINSMSESLRK